MAGTIRAVYKNGDKYPYEVSFYYDASIVARIKSSVPSSERTYLPETHLWQFTEWGYKMLKQEFGAQIEERDEKGKVVLDEWGERARSWFLSPYIPSNVQKQLLSCKRPDGYGLFFGVGCGKTASTICEFLRRQAEGRAHKLIVVVCIAGLKYNWADDVKKLFGRDIAVIDGPLAERAQQIRNSDSVIAVTPYTTCGREDCVNAIIQKYDMVAIDEIHLRVSDRRTIRKKSASGVKRVMSEFGGISRLAKNIPNRLALTGTVAPNKPTNCFTALHFIDPEKFPSKYMFEMRYCIFGGYMGRAVIGYKHMRELKQILSQNGMFATKKDYLDIPRKTEEVRYVEISAQTEKAIKSQLEVITHANESFDELKLRDCYIKVHETFSCPSALWGFKSDKLKALKEVLEDIPENEKVIIFTGFKACVDEVSEMLGDKCVKVTGDMTEKSVELAKEQFKGEIQYMVATIQKMGAGFNLQHANHVIFMDTVATGAEIEQGLGRVHREGQQKETNVVFLITRTPFEMNRFEMIQQQRQIMDTIENQQKQINSQIMRRLLGQILKPATPYKT